MADRKDHKDVAAIVAAADRLVADVAEYKRLADLFRDGDTPQEGVFALVMGTITPAKLTVGARQWLDENGGWALIQSNPEAIYKCSGGIVRFAPKSNDDAMLACLLSEVAMNYMSSPDTKENIDVRTLCAHRLCRMNKFPKDDILEFAFKHVSNLEKQGHFGVRFTTTKPPGGPAIEIDD